MNAFLDSSWMPATGLALVCVAVAGLLLLLLAWGHATPGRSAREFAAPPELSPDGTDDWIFRVIGFFR